MTSPTGNLTNHNEGTGEQMHNLDSGMEQSGLSEKTPQMGSECSGSEKKVLGTALNNPLIDEKSNHVSDILAENPVIQLPAPPQHDLEKSRQTGEGLCLQQSTSEQVPVHLSNDKSENKCQPFSQNVQHELVQMSDAVTGFLVEDQVQSISAQVPIHLSDDNSENKSQPFSQDVDNAFEEMNNTATDFLVEDQTQSISAQVPDHLSDDKLKNTSQPLPQNVQNEFEEMKIAVTGSLVEDQTLYIPAQVPINLSNDESENKCQSFSQNELVEKSDAVTAILVEDQSQCIIGEVPVHLPNDKSENKSQLLSQDVQNELVQKSDAETGVIVDNQTQTQANMSYVDPSFGDFAKSTTPARLRHKGKGNSKLLKKKYMLRSIGSSDRSLRSRTQEKPKAPESSSTLVDVNNDGVKRKKRKKKSRRDEGKIDEFSRIKAHLRYFLNRVSYEQSLIDAYSGEGWKGYSMEKLKPEKELQRAKSAILRRKSQIRDLFQNLDSLCAEGRLPESLFDSEGEIDSEDIFCAKCQSKELSMDNDIILCDGACDRGFHQLCLDPPLLTENIPSGDEGWLCPGCNCKDDCLDLVNDSLGTRLALSDTWERVFPEAAAGNSEDHDFELPSDDSSDDYNPDVSQDEEVEGGESSSDESQYASASEKLEDSHHEDPYLGLPSEDSEDDDYNPNAPDRDNKVTEESSSSDFTSDSEDLAAIRKDNKSPGQGEDITSASLDDFENSKNSSKQKCKVGKRPSLTDELSSLKESDPGQEGCAHVSGKRNVERLDYKRLYDETYKSDTSDDDEDWTATTGRKKKASGELTSVSPDGKVSNNSRPNPRRNLHQNRVVNTNNSPAKSPEGSGKSSKPRFSASKKRLGEAVVQRLYKSFKENQYPDRNTKETLAQELGLTIRQVDKWFGNSRWSFRHSSTSAGGNASRQATDTMAENKGALGGEERDGELVSQEGNGEKSKTPSTRKRKYMSEPQASEIPTDVEIAGTVTPANAQEMQKGHKKKTGKR
ncbi:PREDICTED: homeobox protein HAT3.1 isoform X1 [Lupinus angustifolius]|uniref:homeobox protein HAT3.1 isoform X1 n=1 Tax=Lupinus angustifolius TaxID=3871 RepID=UPI00092FB495|nr:PREDICTED: homeobox protein HAT3.1 isoform X1 [Lupinus angustifolius]